MFYTFGNVKNVTLTVYYIIYCSMLSKLLFMRQLQQTNYIRHCIKQWFFYILPTSVNIIYTHYMCMCVSIANCIVGRAI